jgi:hypothetical protein
VIYYSLRTLTFYDSILTKPKKLYAQTRSNKKIQIKGNINVKIEGGKNNKAEVKIGTDEGNP